MFDETMQDELSDELETGQDDAAETVTDLAFPPGPTVS